MVEKGRDAYFDLLKLIAIFMVVFSHVISYRPGFSFAEMPYYSLNFIMVVNMPLFFVISGYFSRRLHDSGDWHKMFNRLITYFWPLAFFGILTSLLESCIFHKYPILDVPVVTAKKFFLGGWFFYALASCEVITFCSRKYGKNSWNIFFWRACAFIFFLSISGIVPHASNVVAMLPFYWFGIFVLQRTLDKKWLFVTIGVLGGGVMICATYLWGGIAENGLSFYWDRFDVWHPEGAKAMNMLARYVIGILGCVFIMAITRLFSYVVPAVLSLAVLGKETLGVYFLQGYIIKLGSNRVVGLDSNIIVLLLSSVLVFILSYFIVRLTKRLGLLRQIVWGIKFFDGI